MTDKPDPRRVRKAMRDAIKAAAEAVGIDGQGTHGLQGYLAALAQAEPGVFGPMLRAVYTAEEANPDGIHNAGMAGWITPLSTPEEAARAYDAVLHAPIRAPRDVALDEIAHGCQVLRELGEPIPALEDLPRLTHQPSEPRKPTPREPLRPRSRRSIGRELHLDLERDSSRAGASDAHPPPQPFHRIIDAAGHGNTPPQQWAAAAAHSPPDTAAAPPRLVTSDASRQADAPLVRPPQQPQQPPEQPQPREKCWDEIQAEQGAQPAMRRYRGGAADSVQGMRGSSISTSDIVAPLAPTPSLGFRVARDCLDSFAAFKKGGGRCQ